MSRWTNLSNKSFKWKDSSDSRLSKELLLSLTTRLPNKIVVLEILHIWLPCRFFLMQHEHRISVSETQLLVCVSVFQAVALFFSWLNWQQKKPLLSFQVRWDGPQLSFPAAKRSSDQVPAGATFTCLSCISVRAATSLPHLLQGPSDPPTRLQGWGPGPCRIARPLVPPTHAWWAKSIMTGFTSKGRPCEARLPHNWRSRFRAEIILIPLFFWIHDRVRDSRGSFLTPEASSSQPSAGVTSSRRIQIQIQIKKQTKKNLGCDLRAAWVRARF